MLTLQLGFRFADLPINSLSKQGLAKSLGYEFMTLVRATLLPMGKLTEDWHRKLRLSGSKSDAEEACAHLTREVAAGAREVSAGGSHGC